MLHSTLHMPQPENWQKARGASRPGLSYRSVQAEACPKSNAILSSNHVLADDDAAVGESGGRGRGAMVSAALRFCALFLYAVASCDPGHSCVIGRTLSRHLLL